MTIYYKKNEVKLNLFFGIMWLGFGFLNMLVFDRMLLGIASTVLSGLYFILYLNQKKKQYLTIENGLIKQNWLLFGKEMKLDAINFISYGKDKYILKTAEKEMKISVKIIDESSLADLNSVLDQLDVEWVDQ